MVANLCAIISKVTEPRRLWIDKLSDFSVSESSELVASSIINSFGFVKMALAIPILCL